jgi:hypothetical protein
VRRTIGLGAVLVVGLVGIAFWAQPAAANTRVTTVVHVDDTFVDSEICGFDVTFHVSGSLTFADFYDNSGSRYKAIGRAGPGPFTVALTANGTTLIQQNASFTEITTYSGDGSVKTLTDNGAYNKFTAPGRGVVWVDTGHLVVDADFNVLFVVGPRQNGEFDALCAALSG